MSDLDFPVIDAPPAVPASKTVTTAVAAAPAPALDLTKVDLTDVALAQFGKWRENVADVKATLANVVHDLSTSVKLADAKSMRHRLIGQPLAAARKVSQALKSKLSSTSKSIGAELEAIEAAYEEADKLIKPLIEAREAEIAEEKRIAAEKEAARQQVHRDNLAKLAGYAEHARGLPASRIADGIEKVKAIVIDPAAWEEFAQRAEEQKAVTVERMQALHAEAVAAEEAAAEKAEAERKAAELKAQEAKLAAERAEFERQQAEFRAQQEAAAQAQREREAAERAQAEAKAKKDREDAAFESWLSSTNPSGDVESVQRQWEASPDYHELHGLTYTAQITEVQDTQQVLKAEASTPDATDRDAPASTSPSVGSMGAGQPADAGPVAETAAPATETPTLSLGEIKNRIAPLSIDAAGLALLGYPAFKVRASCLYLESDWPDMKAAMRAVLGED